MGSISRLPQIGGIFCGYGANSEGILNSAVYQGSVEKLSLKDLCAIIDDFLKSFDSLSDPDEIMSTVQAQPSMYRVLLDTKASNNYQQLRAKAFGHAVLRTISVHPFPTTDEGPIAARLRYLYPDSPNVLSNGTWSSLSRPDSILAPVATRGV